MPPVTYSHQVPAVSPFPSWDPPFQAWAPHPPPCWVQVFFTRVLLPVLVQLARRWLVLNFFLGRGFLFFCFVFLFPPLAMVVEMGREEPREMALLSGDQGFLLVISPPWLFAWGVSNNRGKTPKKRGDACS